MLKKTARHVRLGKKQVRIGSLSKREAMKFEIEMFETEILYLKGENREKAMKSYRRLVKFQDKPIFLRRNDE